MTELELKKKKLEIARVQLAQQELELKIEERLDDIERLKSHVIIQKQAVERLQNEIKGK